RRSRGPPMGSCLQSLLSLRRPGPHQTAMNHDEYDAAYIRNILREVKRIAMVGASSSEVRPSHLVMKYLLDKGYEVVPVNATLAGQEILGRKVYRALKDIPGPIDMVDIF